MTDVIISLVSSKNFVVFVTIGFIVLGAILKKLTRASSYKIRDFYLGVEFALAATVAAITKAAESVRQLASNSLVKVPQAGVVKVNAVEFHKMTMAICFIPVCIFLFILILSIHQGFEERPTVTEQVPDPNAKINKVAVEKAKEIVCMLFLANAIGLGMIIVYDQLTQ